MRILFLILLLTIAIYWPTLRADYVNWDDPTFVLNNSLVTAAPLTNFPELFTQPVSGCLYPLTLLTFQLEHFFFGFNPTVMHGTNLLLHLLNLVLVFFLLNRLNCAFAVCALTTLFFAIHPVQVEAVAWVSSRKDLLFALFFLLSARAYLSLPAGRSPDWRVMIFFVLSLLAKPMGITLPVVLVLMDVWRHKQLTWAQVTSKGGLWGIAGLAAWVTLLAADGAQALPGTALFPLGERIILSLAALGAYLGKIVFPFGLAALVPFPDPWAPATVWGASGVLLGLLLLWAKWVSSRKGGGVIVALSIFVVMLLPVLHVVRMNSSFTYDRFLYLPVLGIGVVFSALVVAGQQRWSKFILIQAVLLGCLVIGLAALSTVRVAVWRDSVTLWSDAIQKHPRLTTAYVNRAEALGNKQHLVEAFVDLGRAINLEPHLALPYFNRAGLHVALERYEAAIEDYGVALTKTFYDPQLRMETYRNRGVVQALRGEFDLALVDYAAALQLAPRDQEVLFNKSLALFKKADYTGALLTLESLLRWYPGHQMGEQLRILAEKELAE